MKKIPNNSEIRNPKHLFYLVSCIMNPASFKSAFRNPKSSINNSFSIFKFLFSLKMIFILLATVFWLPLTLSYAQVNWGPDIRVTYNFEATIYSPRVALSGDTVHLVWYQRFRIDTLIVTEVMYKHSEDRGVTWDAEVIISPIAPGASQVPDIAVSGSVVHVVWTEEVGDSVVYRRSTDSGRSWGPSRTMTQAGGNPRVGAYGNFVFVEWGRVGGTFYRLSYDGGESWTPEMQIPRPSRLGDKKVQIVNSYIHLAPDGYPTDTSVIMEIFYQYSSDCGQTWSSPVMISKQDVWPSYGPALAIRRDSTVYVDWTDGKNTPYPYTGNIFLIIGPHNGSIWDTIQYITTLYRAKRPDIAVFGNNLHVVWQDHRDYPGSPFDSFEIYYRYSSDGGETWGPEIRLTYDPNDSRDPRIVADSNSVFLVWADNRDLDSIYRGYEVYFKRGDYGQANVNSNTRKDNQLSFNIIPNPASGSVRILFDDLESWVAEVFDVAGRKVWFCEGYGKEVVWHSLDREGNRVSEGVYFVKLKTKEKVGLSKVILLKGW